MKLTKSGRSIFSSGKAREILSRPAGLASQVSNMFHFDPKVLKGSTSRKEARICYQSKAPKIKSFTKVVKVVFIKDVSIPAILNSETIFLEGLMSLSSVDSERDVKHSLTEIINRHSGSSGLREEDLSYLTCSHKRLSYPCVPLTFDMSVMEPEMSTSRINFSKINYLPLLLDFSSIYN